MKFGKQLINFVSHLPPEWQSHFIEYKRLKQQLKYIKPEEPSSLDIQQEDQQDQEKKEVNNDNNVLDVRKDDSNKKDEGIHGEKKGSEESMEEVIELDIRGRASEDYFFEKVEEELNDINEFFILKQRELLNQFAIVGKEFSKLSSPAQRKCRKEYDTFRKFAFYCEQALQKPENNCGTQFIDVALNQVASQNVHDHKHTKAIETINKLSLLYHQMEMLREFANMNKTGIRKILKKHDKKMGTHTKEIFLNRMTNMPFGHIDVVDDLMKNSQAMITSNIPREEDYLCPVCLELICVPVALIKCNHRFCKSCLSKLCRYSHACPLCRKKQSLFPYHNYFDERMEKFLQLYFVEEYKQRLKSQKGSGDHCIVQ